MTQAEQIAALEKEVAALKAIVSHSYIVGPQLKEADFRKLLTPANELGSGDYSLGIAQKLTNYIDRDQAAEIAALKARAATPGPAGPQGPPGPQGPVGPAGSGSGGGGSTGAGYQLFDTRALHLGPPDAALNRALALNENTLSVNAGSIPGSGTAGILLSAKLPESHTFIYQNGGDRSFRTIYNHRHFDPTLMLLREDWEQDGVISWSTEPPANSGRGPWDYPNTQGKMIAFRPAGHNPNTGQAGKYAQIYSGGLGRGLQLGVARTHPNVMDNPSIQVDPDDGANPVAIYADGQLQRVTVKTINGVRVLAPV